MTKYKVTFNEKRFFPSTKHIWDRTFGRDKTFTIVESDSEENAIKTIATEERINPFYLVAFEIK